MKPNLSTAILHYLSHHIAYYTFIIIILFGGTAAGALLVNIYGPLNIMPSFHPDTFMNDKVFSALIVDMIFLLFIWTSGFTLAGLPIAWFVVYMKGCLFGFAAGMMIYDQGLSGVMEAVMILLPHNLLIIVLYIVMAAESLKLAGQIWKGIGARQPLIYTVRQLKNSYTLLLGTAAVGVVLAGIIEFYIPGLLIKIFII
ncbi:stage II sporulation protein M [Jeotgalibacillus terrae]|uniref:Stage II sporulation protein M n=1 Tax=Jeotgalibacillus terrae TaxID=587735 RepID=A0ABW5ZM88_9BACL|nr:stage II sporulation protein M [Jeotgalibacillus terrae]MBM7577493.1 stage II sporulation protein M [Jeotgalibacillus terrae]